MQVNEDGLATKQCKTCYLTLVSQFLVTCPQAVYHSHLNVVHIALSLLA